MKKKRIIIFGIIILLICGGLYCVSITPTPPGQIVSQEDLEKDIKKILNKYRLSKQTFEAVRSPGESYYNEFKKNSGTGDGKILYLHVMPKLGANKKSYIEVEALIDVWLYITEREIPFEIAGIAYRFSAPEEIFKVVIPNEIDMSLNDFMELYQKANLSNESRKRKIEILTQIYLKESGYQRISGHVKVNEKYVIK